MCEDPRKMMFRREGANSDFVEVEVGDDSILEPALQQEIQREFEKPNDLIELPEAKKENL